MLKKALLILYLLLPLICFGQQVETDTLTFNKIKIGSDDSSVINKVLQKAITTISNTTDRPKATIRSEDEYKKHVGKYIRHITVQRLGFERRVVDTVVRHSIATRVSSSLHVQSREWVIRDNLFNHEGDIVDAYKIADNERYLRTIPFLQDARIRLSPVKGHPDSVDMLVITRDIFSIGGKLKLGEPGHQRVALAENNFLGMGQRVELTGLHDKNRDPRFGSQFIYQKKNVKGSFIDATVGYSTIYPNKYDNLEEETSVFFQLDKVLVSPYSKVAGGMTLSYSASDNRYGAVRADTEFRDYSSRYFDVWGGYNLASKKRLTSTMRDRRFLALRYANNYFDKVPTQVGNNIDLQFNDVQLALASMTFFKQNFYKTNYVYGFGITEDIPYGYNFSATTGWYRQQQLKRPYVGLKMDGYEVSKHEDFFRYFLRLGSFYNKGLEDAGVLLGGSWFSRLILYKRYKIRQFVGVSYTHLFNTVTNELLRIDNPFGLQYFNYQYVTGYDRISANLENTVFLPFKFLGFKFSPFLNLNASIITPPKEKFFKSDVYTGIGTGFRTRNENLVFGTIEVRVTYFPREIDGVPSFKFSILSNLRYKYASKYVTEPDIIRWNVDDLQ